MSLDFGIKAQKWSNKTKIDINRAHRAIVLALFNSVIESTPVDQGRLRGNWVLSSDNPSDETIDVTDPQGNKTKRKVKELVSAKIRAGDDFNVFMTNNLPYAYVIEFGQFTSGPTEKVTSKGFSKQAPAGMMRKNFVRITQNLERF